VSVKRILAARSAAGKFIPNGVEEIGRMTTDSPVDQVASANRGNITSSSVNKGIELRKRIRAPIVGKCQFQVAVLTQNGIRKPLALWAAHL
jgi:hypothetical protein